MSARERVSVIYGKQPVLLVAPHGYDDTHTATMTEHAAIRCNGNAVINRGWERDDNVDVLNDKANCNNLKHVIQNVVKDEFFDPMNKVHTRLSMRHPKIYVFHIHGCGNDLRKATGKNLSVIIGHGAGDPNRSTCDAQTRALCSWMIEKDKHWLPVSAASGSRFAAWDRNNLLQAWRHKYRVCALQLEFVTAVRSSRAEAKTSGEYLGDIINNIIASDGVLAPPATYACAEITI